MSNPPGQHRATSAPIAKTPCSIHPSAVLADKVSITGSHHVEIGEHCILHPYAKIRAEGGKVTIGAYSIVSEAAVVGLPEGQDGDVLLEDHVLIDSGAEVMAAKIGSSTEVGIKATIGRGATLGKHCKVAAKWTVKPGAILDDYTVVYGDDLIRKDTSSAENTAYRDAQLRGHEIHIKALRGLIIDNSAKFSSS